MKSGALPAERTTPADAAAMRVGDLRTAWPGDRRLFAACGFREISRHAHPGFSGSTFILMEKAP